MTAAGGWSTGAAGFTSGPSGRGPAGRFGKTGPFGTAPSLELDPGARNNRPRTWSPSAPRSARTRPPTGARRSAPPPCSTTFGDYGYCGSAAACGIGMFLKTFSGKDPAAHQPGPAGKILSAGGGEVLTVHRLLNRRVFKGISMVKRFPDRDGHHPRFLIDGFRFFCFTVLNGYAPPLALVITAGCWLRPSVPIKKMIPSLAPGL